MKNKALYLVLLPICVLIGITYQFNWKNVISLNSLILKEDIRQSIPNYVYTKLYPKYSYPSSSIALDTFTVKMSGDQYMQFMDVRKKSFLDKYYKGEIGLWFADSMKRNYYDVRTSAGKGKIKWIGLNPDMFGNPNRFNFRLNLKNENRFHGYDKLNIIKSFSRFFIVDRVANEVFIKMDGFYIPSIPIYVTFNKQKFGNYLAEPHMSKQLVELNRYRNGELAEIYLKNYGTDTVSVELNIFNSQDRDLKFTDWVRSHVVKQDLMPLVDKNKLFTALAVSYLMGSYHNLGEDNFKWYYNPLSNQLEPLLRELIVQESIDSTSLEHYYEAHFMTGDPSLERFYIRQNFPLEKFSSEIEKYLPTALQLLEDYMKSPEYDEYVSLLGPKVTKEIARQERRISNRVELFRQRYGDAGKEEYNPILETASSPMVISSDTTITSDSFFPGLTIEQGATITLEEAVIYVDGDLKISGSSQYPVHIISDDTLSSIFVHNSKRSDLDYVNFKGLANLDRNFHQLPSAVTFYNCEKVNIGHAKFESNARGDDYINFFRVKHFELTESEFIDVVSDAIDSDFSDGLIENSSFYRIGNDGIDGSGSVLTIKKTQFDSVFDKAISAGEKSEFLVDSVTVLNSEIAFVSKDLSKLKCQNFSSDNNKLDFAVFQKKPEFGPAMISIDVNFNDFYYLFQKGTLVETSEDITFVKNVEELLYGAQFGRATNKL